MPDPRELRPGDRIRFTALPDAWSRPGYDVAPESIAVMEALIARGRPARIASLDADGYPWIDVRLRRNDGVLEHHAWGIFESTGWVRVVTRS